MSRKQLLFDMVPQKSSKDGSIIGSITFDDDDSCDSGFGSENESSPTSINLSSIPRFSFSLKRKRCEDEVQFHSKKPRSTEEIQPSLSMKDAVDKMDTETDLIGDGSQNHRLPVIPGRHKDLKSLSPDTISKLLEGKFDDVIPGFQIIDCRYPYEYEGGHIEGAFNLHTKEMITELVTKLKEKNSTDRNILIFHCEFSSERGPKLLRHLRSMDRKLNSEQYPFLYFPEVYLLDGGYKAFYELNKNHCEPRNYVPMLHENFTQQLRHFRVKSKSWSSGDKQSMRCRRHMTLGSPMKLSLLL